MGPVQRLKVPVVPLIVGNGPNNPVMSRPRKSTKTSQVHLDLTFFELYSIFWLRRYSLYILNPVAAQHDRRSRQRTRSSGRKGASRWTVFVTPWENMPLTGIRSTCGAS